MVATVLGAVAGGVLGYLYLTEPGARLRERFEPGIDEFVGEIRRLRGTVEKARQAADEGWRSFTDIVGERPREAAWPSARTTAAR
jgi:hypothetical protein